MCWSTEVPEKLVLAAGRTRQVFESPQDLLFVVQDRQSPPTLFGCGESPKGTRYLFTEEPDIELRMTNSHMTPSPRDSKTDAGLPLANWPETESRLAAELKDVRTLDIGCGPHKLKGAVGIDLRPLPGVDLVQDLDRHPWALPANQYEFIRCQHVIEHLSDLFGLAREIHRVGRSGGVVEFRTPHYSSYASWGDPTHRWHFSLGSIPQLFEMALGAESYKVRKIELRFTGSALDFFGWAIYRMSKKTYEKHFAWIFPANEIVCEIEIVK